MPALPLGPLPDKQVMYLNDGAHQPLCNKLKRLGITCIFVAAKVSSRPFLPGLPTSPFAPRLKYGNFIYGDRKNG